MRETPAHRSRVCTGQETQLQQQSASGSGNTVHLNSNSVEKI